MRFARDIFLTMSPGITIILYYLSLVLPWYLYEGPITSNEYGDMDISLINGTSQDLIGPIVSAVVPLIGLAFLAASLYRRRPSVRFMGSGRSGFLYGFMGTLIISSSILYYIGPGFEIGGWLEKIKWHLTMTVILFLIAIIATFLFSVLGHIRTRKYIVSSTLGRPESILRKAMIGLGVVSVLMPIIAIISLPLGSGQDFGKGGQFTALIGLTLMTVSTIWIWKSGLNRRNAEEYRRMVELGEHDRALELSKEMGCDNLAAEHLSILGRYEESAKTYEYIGMFEKARALRSRFSPRVVSLPTYQMLEGHPAPSRYGIRGICFLVLFAISLILIIFSLTQPVWFIWDYDKDVEAIDDDYRNYHIRYHKESGPWWSEVSYESWAVDENGNRTNDVGYVYPGTEETTYHVRENFSTNLKNDVSFSSIFLIPSFLLLIFEVILIVPAVLVFQRSIHGFAVSIPSLLMVLLLVYILSFMSVIMLVEESQIWENYYWDDTYPKDVQMDLTFCVTPGFGYFALWLSFIFLFISSIVCATMVPKWKYIEKARYFLYSFNWERARDHYSLAGLNDTANIINGLITSQVKK